MKSKKEIKQQKELKERMQRKKDKAILFVGILIFFLAMVQFTMIIFYYVNASGHNQIMMGDKVITTEVCTEWFKLSPKYQAELDDFYYKEQPIPTNIVEKVCDRWKKVKDKVDSQIINQSYINN